MLKKNFIFFAFALSACLTGFTAYGESAVSMGDANLRGSLEPSDQAESTIAQDAKLWGLTSDDYQKYLREMSEGPNGYWWKNIDPPQVLGMNATTPEEQMKYAKIDVQLDQERASKELSFQHAYSKAFNELYPGALMIQENQS